MAVIITVSSRQGVEEEESNETFWKIDVKIRGLKFRKQPSSSNFSAAMENSDFPPLPDSVQLFLEGVFQLFGGWEWIETEGAHGSERRGLSAAASGENI